MEQKSSHTQHSDGTVSSTDSPYRPCNLVVCPDKCWSEMSPMCTVYTNFVEYTSTSKIAIRVIPSVKEYSPTTCNTADAHTCQPGVDMSKRMVDGYIFNSHPDEFHEACENKYSGYGACSSEMIIPSLEIDFATFDMESWLTEVHSKHPKIRTSSESSIDEGLDVAKLKSVKQHIHKVHGNLSSYTYPGGIPFNKFADVGWMLKLNVVESMNVHLIHKLVLWQKGHLSYIDKVISSNDLPSTVVCDQKTFVQTLVGRAICGIAQCNIPVWLMSEDRMIEIIDGIDSLAVAQLVKNTASYDQFIFESHLSLCSGFIYVKTVHHGHNFDHVTRDYFFEVFYGLDYQNNVVNS